MIKSKTTIGTILAIIILSIISIILRLATALTITEALRITFGSVYVLFLPGFIVSFIFFPKGKIDVIERVALSFALSIAIVPLAVFYLNLIGIKISLLNSFLTVLGIVIVAGVVAWYRNKDFFSK